MISKIVSGGQTGVDRAALDTAISIGVSHGGWVPMGRKAEDGVIDERYKLKEMHLFCQPFWPCRPRSKSEIFDLPSKFSLDLATKPFSDSLLGGYCSRSSLQGEPGEDKYCYFDVDFL